jgi:uncharacterized protein YecE (DUF72 family)
MALPAASTFGAWRRAVPRRFLFAVKASRYATHLEALERSARTAAAISLPSPTPGAGAGAGAVSAARDVPGERRTSRHVSPRARTTTPRRGVARGARGPSRLVADRRDHRAPARRRCRRHGTLRRYRGSYPTTMLRADARAIRRWLADGRDVSVYFNNDSHGHAVPQRAASSRAPGQGELRERARHRAGGSASGAIR